MPAEKRVAADKKDAKPQKRKFYLRLRRGGMHGEEGLARYLLNRKLYRREGIYRVDKKTRVKLKATGKFEDILPEDLGTAQKEAKAGRGLTIDQRSRLKRREAQRLRRRRTMPQVDDLDDDLDSSYELSDDEVEAEFADDPDDPDGPDSENEEQVTV